MIFKSLHLQGFKSFVDKTPVEFPPGITAIVGPNGSGKSNLMDALRWVFGEQRVSELRGGDMEDVIFAGSEKRRPAGFAEVALTLADLPAEISSKWGTFSDITVSRAIYRTGEREYCINGRRCRLKDVREIFFDTGLGTKSISIIEQERVTKIINSTPEELRYFLEETAGVVRYKERRKEAEVRLRQTRDNLLRINDLLALLSADVQRLALQVEQIRRYKALRHIKEESEKILLCLAYSQNLKEKESLVNSVNGCIGSISGLVASHQGFINDESSCLKKREALREALKNLLTEYNAARDGASAADGDISRLQSSLASAEHLKAQLSEDMEQARMRISELSERMEEVETALKEASALSLAYEARAEDCRNRISEKREDYDAAQKEIKNHNRRYYDITQKVAELGNRKNLKEAELGSRRSSIARLVKEKESLKAEILAFESEIEEFAAMVSELEAQRGKITEEISNTAGQLKQLEKVYSAADEEYRRLDVSLKTAAGRMEIFESEISAKLSTSAEAGRIVAEFGGRPYIGPEELHMADYIMYADLMVFGNDKKEKLIGCLKETDLSMRFIFESDMSNIKEKSTLEQIGQRLFREGMIYRSVGSDNHGLALMGLRQNLADERYKRSGFEKEMAVVSEKLKSLGATMSEERRKLAGMNERQKKADLDYTACRGNLKHLEEQHSRAGRNVAVIDKEMEVESFEIIRAEKELEAMRIGLNEAAAARNTADEERLQLEENVQRMEDGMETLRREYSNVSNELVRFTERENAFNSEKDKLIKDRNSAGVSLQNLSDRFKKLTEVQTVNWRNELTEAVERKGAFTKSTLRLSDLIKTKESEQAETESSLAELRGEIDRLSARLHEFDKKSLEYKTRLENVVGVMESISSKAENLYHIDVSAVWPEMTKQAPSRQKLAEQIATAEKEIEDLGALNMAAESEYDEKSKQHSGQTQQRGDIEGAISSLEGLIGEIDENTAQLFDDTYNSVRAKFKEVFTRFFGSGNADLLLTEPDNMLTTGVELSISPAGKKISNKNLLSGGEKALAALTLLFALFLQKPTPFCFLDEVDAPLDDTNADRFISMVRSLSDKTQFIIITHKHQTMAAADSLYGVTMQEGGVSTILSVELK